MARPPKLPINKVEPDAKNKLKKVVWQMTIPASMSDNGKLRRCRFPSKAAAEKGREKIIRNQGLLKKGLTLTPGDENEAIEARVMMAKAGCDIGFRDLVRFWIEHHPKNTTAVSQLLEAYRDKSSLVGRSDIYLRDQQTYFGRLTDAVGTEPLSSMTSQRLRAAMETAFRNATGKVAPHQWNNAVRHLRAAWKWGYTEQLVSFDPFEFIKQVQTKRSTIKFLPVDVARSLIEACNEQTLGY
ncbi:MAG: hypothetical protein ACI9DF_005726, partial [Verrucomicrobiales bacterium]